MIKFFSVKERGGFTGNLAYAVVSQGIGLFSSIVVSLVLPKLIGVDEFAYWQLFIMYSSYSGFALFGLNDGIYLRLGGKRYSDVDYGELKAEQLLVVISQLIIAAGCFIAIDSVDFEQYRTLVLKLCVLFGLLSNVTQCLRYVFQCTNLTRISSIADLIAKGLFLLCMGTILFVGIDSSLPFIACYIVCQFIALVYILVCARDVLLAKASFGGIVNTCIADMRAGLKIMVSYYADSLIVGFTRMLTDWRLGLLAFGRLSLSFSLTNFFLTFIGQVSMVAFPILKRLSADEQKEKYLALRLILNAALPCVYLLYVPARIVLNLWLPDYEQSFVYLALTLPLCVYNCKVNFLFNNYLKMERREGTLCMVNLASMFLNGAFAMLSVVGFASVELATFGIVLTVIIRDFGFEWIMARKFGNVIMTSCIFEAAISFIFMAASWCFGLWSYPFVVAFLGVYLSLNREGVKLIRSEVMRRFA